MKKLKVLAIIPAYNEEGSIKKVVEDLEKNAKGIDYVIVNDGSTDKTLEVIKKNKYNHIDLFVNLGVFGAVQTGFLYALENGYDCAMQFDGDGQHKAETIKKMLPYIEDYNIVIGSRFAKKKRNYSARMIGSRILTTAIFLVTGKKIYDPTSGLRIYDRQTMIDYAKDQNNPPEPDTLVYMLKKKKKIIEIPVEMDERVHGQSYFKSYTNSARFMARMIISIILIQPFRKR